MSATSVFRRSLLTAARPRPVSSVATSRIHQSIFTPRFFSATKMAKQGVHNLQSKADWDAALKEPELVVLDCFATWCGPCKVIAPQVVKFSDLYPNAKFYKLDVDEVPEVAQELGIRAMPTFLLFKGGEKIGEVVGANPKALEAAIKEHLGQA
ncbi:thioredoxin-domain-containing protein [Saccharata proteae CBS 121410]|uniref:Thioredoxin-domain-containing protein n=1 Tax=Saccharata proteae CBS 121410 TaxID=1314787 RepID=A0A9P4LVR2_9PEZI|nr:thioredoxin-domain-containing protein [Saccharata proteae CBS 121410]